MWLKLNNRTINLMDYHEFYPVDHASNIYADLVATHGNHDEEPFVILTDDKATVEALYAAIHVSMEHGDAVFDLPRWLEIRDTHYSLNRPENFKPVYDIRTDSYDYNEDDLPDGAKW